MPGQEEEFRDSIGLTIDYASAFGCPLVHVMAGVLPENLGRERAMETFADNLYFTATACAKEGIGVLIEPLNGEDLLAAIEENLDPIRHMQVAGATGRHESEDGDIDYGALFESIEELGYGGWIGCEYRPRAGTMKGLGWAAAYGIG